MKSSYWTETRTPLYSFIFSMPLILIYELGVFAISASDLPMLRNGADVLMRQILHLLGIYGMYGFSGMFLAVFGMVYWRQKKSLKKIVIKGEYLLWMLLESVIWAILLSLVLAWFPRLLMWGNEERLLQQAILAIGAGIYEEFVFRVILITGIGHILGFLFLWGPEAKKAGGVILAAVLFSLFHFVGEFGDSPDLNLFLLRFVAGVYLGLVYIFRGFGVAAYTHTIYDLFVLVQFTVR
jgi:membrane protease YdiL (CAAX protease family)